MTCLVFLAGAHSPVFSQNKLEPDRLQKIIYWFTTRPGEMIYIEDQEYIQTGLLGIRKYFIFRFKKKEEHGQITHRKYLEGDRHRGTAALGGLVVYDRPYPFMPAERPKYKFLRYTEQEIVFYPVVEDKLLYAGRLYLDETGFPQRLLLVPRFKFPSLDYFYKEVIFQKVSGHLVEKYIEIHGAFYIAPFIRHAVRYKVLRFDYEFEKVEWK